MDDTTILIRGTLQEYRREGPKIAGTSPFLSPLDYQAYLKKRYGETILIVHLLFELVQVLAEDNHPEHQVARDILANASTKLRLQVMKNGCRCYQCRSKDVLTHKEK